MFRCAQVCIFQKFYWLFSLSWACEEFQVLLNDIHTGVYLSKCYYWLFFWACEVFQVLLNDIHFPPLIICVCPTWTELRKAFFKNVMDCFFKLGLWIISRSMLIKRYTFSTPNYLCSPYLNWAPVCIFQKFYWLIFFKLGWACEEFQVLLSDIHFPPLNICVPPTWTELRCVYFKSFIDLFSLSWACEEFQVLLNDIDSGVYLSKCYYWLFFWACE